MAKHALVVMAEGSEEIEAVTPGDVLVRAGVRVTTAGIGPDGVGAVSFRGSRGLPLAADIPIERAVGRTFDAVIVPGGGPGSKLLASCQAVRVLLESHAAAGLIIGAICAAPAVVLAPLGLLDGKRATGYPGTETIFPKSCTHATEAVVVDGTLITSRGPATAIPFSLALAEALTDRATRDEVAEAMLTR